MMMLNTWLPLATLMLFMAGNASAKNETRVFKMGLLTPWHIGYDFSGYTSASAISIAIDKVHADPQLNANGRIKLRYTMHYVSILSSQCVSSIGQIIKSFSLCVSESVTQTS